MNLVRTQQSQLPTAFLLAGLITRRLPSPFLSTKHITNIIEIFPGTRKRIKCRKQISEPHHHLLEHRGRFLLRFTLQKSNVRSSMDSESLNQGLEKLRERIDRWLVSGHSSGTAARRAMIKKFGQVIFIPFIFATIGINLFLSKARVQIGEKAVAPHTLLGSAGEFEEVELDEIGSQFNVDDLELGTLAESAAKTDAKEAEGSTLNNSQSSDNDKDGTKLRNSQESNLNLPAIPDEPVILETPQKAPNSGVQTDKLNLPEIPEVPLIPGIDDME